MEREIMKTKILILAGGKGKRMESELPKVLLTIDDKPMVKYVLDAVGQAINSKPIVIVGHKRELVQGELGDAVHYAVQEEQLGTGHAVVCAKDHCVGAEHVMVLSGDQPFVSAETIKSLIKKHAESGAKVTLTTTLLENFEDWRTGFVKLGRILRNDGKIVGIKEYKDANDEEKEIKETNVACYIFNAPWMWENLNKISNENAAGEYYLTDLIKIASENDEVIESISIGAHEALGANTKEELETLNALATPKNTL